MDEFVKLSLTKDEAIVFFEFTSRFSSENKLSIEDKSEERVLWNIQSDLEKVLIESFQENYTEILLEARNNVRDIE